MSLTPSDPRLKAALSLHQSGLFTEAGAKIEELLKDFPEMPPLWAHLGTIRLQQGQPTAALEAFDRALGLDPSFFPAQTSRAQALEKLGRLEEALAGYEGALAVKPEAWLFFNRGNVLRDLGRLEQAVESYGEALRVNPGQAEALANQGALYLRARQPLRALENFNRAVDLRPGDPDALNNRGNALRALGRPGEALADYDRALALRPGHPDSLNNRGIALQELGRVSEALAEYDKAIAGRPDFAFAYWNKSQALLLDGRFEEGWRLFEWRWKSATKEEARAFDRPLWLGGQSLAGKTILIWAEQGMGDILQYARYVPLLEKEGARVFFEVPAALLSLSRTLPGGARVLEKGGEVPPLDFHCPLLSLPLAFKTTLQSVPGTVPYLSADPAQVEAWGRKLGAKTKPRVGLAWSGRPEHSNDHNRSIPLKDWAPLLNLPLEFHSLQKDLKGEDLAFLQSSGRIRDHRDCLGDFSDTAALAANLDLVVSVDSSAAHLAGALGRPLWVLVPFAPDYRWLLKRPDNPWYPQARLFRQPKIGDWESALETVKRELKGLP
ncbi:MAG TPA: tetratricopeptide repeat protein [bacterium]|nr:tetratricopeptide repeat protein [bacterium]